MHNMTKSAFVLVVLGSMVLTGCGVSRAFTEAKEAVSVAFTSSTPTEQLDKYEQEVNAAYPATSISIADDKTKQRISADKAIKRNSALIVKCDQLLEKMPPRNVEKNDAAELQERENIESRRAVYLASLKEVCTKAKTDQLAVSLPTGPKFLPRDHEAYATLRDTPTTASSQ